MTPQQNTDKLATRHFIARLKNPPSKYGALRRELQEAVRLKTISGFTLDAVNTPDGLKVQMSVTIGTYQAFLESDPL